MREGYNDGMIELWNVRKVERLDLIMPFTHSKFSHSITQSKV